MENNLETNQKNDDSFKGFIIVGIVLVLLIGFIYLLSIQQKSEDCQTTYNPDGTVRTGCALSVPLTSPTPETTVELLDQLNQDEVSEVDKRLQEAAQDIIRQQEQRQNQIPSIPKMPQ